MTDHTIKPQTINVPHHNVETSLIEIEIVVITEGIVITSMTREDGKHLNEVQRGGEKSL